MRAKRDPIVQLLKTARGQMDGILRMVEEDRYCIDISNQLMATESILGKANKEILRAHMEGCVYEALRDGTEKQKMDEIIDLLDKLLK
jgi:DNA-binding FrmR family transcriptional regulator